MPTALNPGQFSTPQSKPPIPSAASTPNLDAESLTPSSSIGCSPLSTTSSSTLTPNLDSMKLGCGRGRPHKEITPIDFSDFPHNASKKEQEKWAKRKNMERWRYAKKMGPKSHEYRQAESKHSLEYYYKKKEEKAQATQGSQGNASQEVVDIQDDIDDGDVVVTGQGQAERSKELSRQR